MDENLADQNLKARAEEQNLKNKNKDHTRKTRTKTNFETVGQSLP
jgi:hypothetical protein